MRDLLLQVLTTLHARGLHAAVLAALIVMPTVATVGYLTRGIDRIEGGSGDGQALRPTLTDSSVTAEP